MLESMTYRQYLEWLAFFKIRNEDKPQAGAKAGTPPQGGYGTSPEGQKQLSAAVVRAMQGYQRRRDKMKRK